MARGDFRGGGGGAGTGTDGGSGGVLACAIAAAILSVSLLALSLFSAVPARARVQAAADSAAIAAAESLGGKAVDGPCEVAGRAAEINGAILQMCSLSGSEATVTVTRVILGINVSVTSRAGIDEGRDPGSAGANGDLPLSSLTLVTYPGVKDVPGVYLRPDAATALTALLDAYHNQTGEYLPVDEGYRDLAGQQQAFDDYGWPRAAIPGTSNHGDGTAVDFVNPPVLRGYAAHEWLAAHAAAYGFDPLVDPDEPWHWQFSGTNSALR